MARASFLLALLLLAGCDKLTGAADQKIADAEAIGFACRVSGKAPEACMKENEAQSPSSLLDGWKTADEDIKAGKLDPSMSNMASGKKEGEEAAPAAEGEEKPAEEAKDGEAAPEGGKDGKTAAPVAEDAQKDEEKAKH
jgi:hypothetical protein